MKLQVVVGAQFGSEAKGHVVQRLTERAQELGEHPTVVRVAGPNAGHTGYSPGGKRWALRQIPVGALVPGSAVLGIADGSEIDLPVLLDEYDRLHADGLLADKVLWVSDEATMINNRHKAGDFDLVERIGSTGKGIGSARADRVMRVATRLRDDEAAMREISARGIAITRGTPPYLNGKRTPDTTVILEGTQGYGLGLHSGYYPQCTSSDCRAVDFLAMAGINPWSYSDVEVWAVARVYPIRVAGNSGPLKEETTWEALGLPAEQTTVTQKTRRVGHEDWDLVQTAVQANGGSPTVRVALTMLDQKFPELRDVTDPGSLDKTHLRFLRETQIRILSQIDLLTTGPDSAIWHWK